MFPILVSIGPIHIVTAHVFLIIAWCMFSFLFWRYLRTLGILEERIFDLLFYATIIGVIFARLGFVVLFPQLFMESILLIGAFWVQPGFWLYSGILGVLLTYYVLSKRFHLRFAHVFDAFVFAVPWTLLVIVLGLFFQGKEIGKVTDLPWAIVMSGIEGKRHPVQLYESIALLIVGLLVVFLYKKAAEGKWPAGLSGAIGLTIMTPVLFALEFFKSGSLYLYGITVNQWVLILVFAESIGSVIIKLRHMGVFSKKGKAHESKPSHQGGITTVAAGTPTETSGNGTADSGAETPGPVSEPGSHDGQR